MKKMRAGIIGCGLISDSHGGFLNTWEGSEIVAVCDINKEKLSIARDKYNCRGYADYKELINDKEIDIVHICTPHYLHSIMAIDAMKAGKNVFCEKPMATNEEDALKMIKTSELTGMKLGICFQNRYNPESVKLKELIDSGDYGNVIGARGIVTWYRTVPYYIESGWRGTWEKEGGGVLINQAIHTIDLIQWFTGQPVKLRASVFNGYLHDTIEVEDTAAIYMETATGVRSNIYATNSYVTNSRILLEIACEKAFFRIDNGLYIHQNNKEPIRIKCESENEDVESLRSYWGSSHGRIIKDFYRCVSEGGKFRVDGNEGVTAVRIVESSYKSSNKGDFILFEGECK